MKKTLWDVIKESKGEKEFVASRTHCKKLEKVLANMEEENAKQVVAEWKEKLSTLHNFKLNEKSYFTDFDRLHESQSTGFVDGNDDEFYTDFGNWVIAQGEELYNAFFEKGYIAVIEYKKKHKVQRKDYGYDRMGNILTPYFN